MNLQHDGIVTGSLGGRQSQEVARGMQEAASHACGHEVQVKGELIWCDAAEEAAAPIWAEVAARERVAPDSGKRRRNGRQQRARRRPPTQATRKTDAVLASLRTEDFLNQGVGSGPSVGRPALCVGRRARQRRHKAP